MLKREVAVKLPAFLFVIEMLQHNRYHEYSINLKRKRMMKRIVLIWMIAFLMGGMAMAQRARRSDNMPDPKVRAERMTERMAKEYSLNDKQKKQLLEANVALVEKMGEASRRMDMRKGKRAKGDCCCCAKSCERSEKAGKKDRQADEQRAERTKARDSYNEQLQKIMTSDQYAAYTKKCRIGKPV